MGNKKTLILLVLVLGVLIAGALALYNGFSQNMEQDRLATTPVQTTETTGTVETTESLAPDFTVYDAEGNVYRLSDFRGKPVVLNFWASWCGPCKSEMPDFEAAYQKYKDSVHFLMVNLTDGMQETQKSAAAFIAQSGYTFPVYYDTELSAATAYSVWSIPTTYFLDAAGHLVTWGSGALDATLIEKGIGMILTDPA